MARDLFYLINSEENSFINIQLLVPEILIKTENTFVIFRQNLQTSYSLYKHTHSESTFEVFANFLYNCQRFSQFRVKDLFLKMLLYKPRWTMESSKKYFSINLI